MNYYENTNSSEAQAGITHRFYFVDKLRFWTKRRLSHAEIKALRPYCGGFRRMKLTADERATKGRFMAARGWFHRYQVEQPQPEALMLLHAYLGSNALVNYVELALELICNSRQETLQLHRWIERHWWQGWRSKKQVSANYDGATYSGNRTAQNRYTAYSDRPSKVTGAINCCKLEWRINGSTACKGKGMHSFLDINSFDHFGFWKSNLRLSEIDRRKLQLDYCRKFRRRLPRHRPNSSADMMIVIASHGGLADASIERSIGAIQDVKAGWKWDRFPIKKYMKSLSNEWILSGTR